MKKVVAPQASTRADTTSASKIKSAYTKEARDSISARGATTISARGATTISARGATTISARGATTISARGATTISARGATTISARGATTISARGATTISASVADTDLNAFSYMSTRRKSEVIVTYIMQRTYASQAEIDAIMPCIIDGKEYRIQTSKDPDGIRITAIYRTILDDIIDTITEEISALPESEWKTRIQELARKYTVEEKIRYTQLFLPSDQKPAFIEKLIADFESQKYKPKVIASTDTTGMNLERQRSIFLDVEELRLYINKKIPTIAAPFFKEKTTKALSTLPSANVKKAQLDLYRQELATIIIDNVTYEIENFQDVKKHMTASTMKIVDFLLNEDIKFVGNTFRSSVKEFMEFRGLKDFNSAKQQLIDGFRFLSKLVWTSEEKKKGKKVGSSTRISIWGGYSNVEDGKIEFTFGEKFLESLEGCSVKKKNRQLMNTNDHKNPYSYFFGDTITTHKHMNRLKSNANLISVRTIISKCPIFPTYDEVITTGRQIQQRIIDPFERDMTALSEMFSWEYCHTNGIPLSDDEIQNFNYDVFINCLVKIVWKNDPYIEEVKNKTLKIGQKKPA